MGFLNDQHQFSRVLSVISELDGSQSFDDYGNDESGHVDLTGRHFLHLDDHVLWKSS